MFFRSLTYGLLMAAIAGCGFELSSKHTDYKVRMLGSVACVPGKPVLRPGTELIGKQVGLRHDSAYVWLEFSRDGNPVLEKTTFNAIVSFPDGRRTMSLIMTDKSSVARISIPGGYDKKPAYAELTITTAKQTVGTFRIDTLAAPIKVIGDNEPRMKKPRWKATQLGNARLLLDMNENPADLLSVVSVKRASFLDFSDMFYIPQITVYKGQPRVESLAVSMPPQKEIELEERQYRSVSGHIQLQISDWELEEVFDTPVLKINKPTGITTESGYRIEIPEQRFFPHRKGRRERHDGQIKLVVVPPKDTWHTVQGLHMTPQIWIEKVSEDLGRFGVWDVRVLAMGQGILLNNTLKFKGRSSTIKVGKLPPTTIYLKMTWSKAVAVHRGIIPVEQGKAPSPIP